MANNDKIIGAIMSIIAVIGVLVELIFILSPLWSDPSDSAFQSTAQYWAIAVPVLIGVLGVLGIVFWIGLTMVQTPAPEEWDFEDLEDEFDEDFETEDLDDEEDEDSEMEEPKVEEGMEDDGALEDIEGVTARNIEGLREAGYNSRADLKGVTVEELKDIKGIGKVTAEKIVEDVNS